MHDVGSLQKDDRYETRGTGYRVMKLLLGRNNSNPKHFKSKVLLKKQDELPTIFEARPLRYYDGKLLWRSSDMKLTLFDVVGKSIAEIELDSPKALKFGDLPIRPNWEDNLEKLYAFDILFENTAKTKYPATVDGNNLNVIPAVIDALNIQFDKKVHLIKSQV